MPYIFNTTSLLASNRVRKLESVKVAFACCNEKCMKYSRGNICGRLR